MNSGQLRSKFPSNYAKKSNAKLSHTFRSGVTAKNKTIFARAESKKTIERVNRAQSLLQTEKDKVKTAKAEKALLDKAIANKPAEHLREPIKRDFKGFYIQPRIKGRFQAKQYLA